MSYAQKLLNDLKNIDDLARDDLKSIQNLREIKVCEGFTKENISKDFRTSFDTIFLMCKAMQTCSEQKVEPWKEIHLMFPGRINYDEYVEPYFTQKRRIQVSVDILLELYDSMDKVSRQPYKEKIAFLSSF